MEVSWSAILDTISWAAVIIIMAFITIRSVLDVAKGMGFLPSTWYNLLYKSEEERFKRLLNDLGILPRKKHYQALTNFLDNPSLNHTHSMSEIEKSLVEICKGHITKQDLTVGDNSKLKIQYFLSLRKAFLNDHDLVLAKLMASFIVHKTREEGINFDAIVSRKSAFDILGYLVSKILNVPFILCHDHKSIFGNKGIVPFDFFPSNVSCPLIVDDSCVGGSSIIEIANYLKSENINSSVSAFVFFTRKPDLKEKMEKNGVVLHYLKYFDDASLEALLNSNDNL